MVRFTIGNGRAQAEACDAVGLRSIALGEAATPRTATRSRSRLPADETRALRNVPQDLRKVPGKTTVRRIGLTNRGLVERVFARDRPAALPARRPWRRVASTGPHGP